MNEKSYTFIERLILFKNDPSSGKTLAGLTGGDLDLDADEFTLSEADEEDGWRLADLESMPRYVGKGSCTERTLQKKFCPGHIHAM